ncbi:MAG: hypothetical protein H0W64_10810 [Gammaproteobacteria bacterium]|nr:hypothetical protein [Gammaproteobacteria bacterium]
MKKCLSLLYYLQFSLIALLSFSASAYTAPTFNLADNYAPFTQNIPLRNARLLIPTPVPMTVSVANANWVETISLCNTSGKSLSLKKMEFRFNYASPMPTNIWGEPWAAWNLVSQEGAQVVLSGGTEFIPELPSDPYCMRPLTIKFYAPPTIPAPTGPFEFKTEQSDDPVPPDETGGAVNVTTSASPAADLPVPIIAINGLVNNQQRQVDWGGRWKLSSLEPGSYLVTGVAISAAGKTYTAQPTTVTVVAGATVDVQMNYAQDQIAQTLSSNLQSSARTIHFTNNCPFPIWFGLTSGITPNRTGASCQADSDCYAGSVCVDRGAGSKQCFWKNPIPTDGNFKLDAKNGTSQVQIPVYENGLNTIWSGAVAGRTQCTGQHCETADCGGGDGSCSLGKRFNQPATQAEFSLGKSSPDFYNIAIINGMNVPLTISPLVNESKNVNPYLCGKAGSVQPQNQMGGCNWTLQPPTQDYIWVKAGGKSCTAPKDCVGFEQCGLSYTPDQTPTLQKTCGPQLGYWTANQICAIDKNFGAPFNCSNKTPHGCVDWNKLGVEVAPPPYTRACGKSDVIFETYARTQLLWMKKACPSVYTYAEDDFSSTFMCQVKGDKATEINKVNYNITFCPGGKTGFVTQAKS